MSLAIRSTYLSWTIGTAVGLALWYRNIGLDRTIAGYVLVASLVFLFEYGLLNMGKPETMIKWILGISALSLIIFAVLQRLTQSGATTIRNIYLFLAVIIGAMMFYETLISTPVQEIKNFTSWGHTTFFYFYLFMLFLGFIISSYITHSWSFCLLSFILLLAPILTPDSNSLGYTLFNLILLIVLLRWILVYFESDFHHLITK